MVSSWDHGGRKASQGEVNEMKRIVISMRNPSYPDPSESRTKKFAFNFKGGGYNDVYARNKWDAICLANSWFGGSLANLEVVEGTVREITDVRAYHAGLPTWD